MAILIISHDLGLAASFADEVVVMYAGRAVERAPAARAVRERPDAVHGALLGAVPRLDRAAAHPAAGDRRPAAGPVGAAGRLPVRGALPAGGRAVRRS